MIDLMEMYNRRNQELAIQGAVKYRLEEILSLLGKNRLTDIATSIGLPGRSSMKKAELAARLPEVLLKEYRLDATLLLAREEEFQFFQNVRSQPCLQADDITPGTYLHFVDYGVLFTFWQKDKLYFVIPEEVKEALRQLDWDALLLTRAREQVVLQYVNAAVNLYGVCTPELILEIYNDQNDQSLRLQDLEEITDFHLKRVQFYERMDGYYVSQYFDESTVQEMQALLKRIQNKPRYIPSKEKFLMYSDDHYSEMTPQLLQLRLFILNQLCEDAELVDSAIDDIQIACSMEEPLQSIVNELDRRGITFDNINQVKRFSSLVTEVYNHTRLWSNCGHTPAELGALTGGSAIRAIPGQRVVAAKVGRNDPCPCGSGKKYKKCCGEQ